MINGKGMFLISVFSAIDYIIPFVLTFNFISLLFLVSSSIPLSEKSKD